MLDEHLIREVGEARIGSLHQIRANHLFEITHRLPPPTITTTISRTTRCIAIEDIEGYTARTLAYEPERATSLIEALASRLRERSNLREIADALRGLDRGRIANVVEEWLPELKKLGVPPTQATNAAMFAVADTKDFGIDRLKPLCDASQLLRIKFRGEDPRLPLLQELLGEPATLLGEPATLLAAASPEELTEFLAALSGVNVPRKIIDALRLLGPDLLHDDLAKVQALLETAHHTSPEVAEIWVDRVGQGKLLHRISAETPWVSEPILSDEPEGLAAAANIFHISDRLQPNIHDDVVALCERLFALAPRIDLTISNALAPDRTPSGIGDYTLATKRIPRANLPPKALPQRNQRWIAAVAERLGAQSMTQYLADAKNLIDQLIGPLEDVVDGVLRGKRHDRHLGSLGAIHEAAQTLARPANADQLITAGESGIGVMIQK